MKSKKKYLRVAIAGAGNIGYKRAEAIMELKNDRLAGVYDIDQAKSRDFAKKFNIRPFQSWQEILADPEIDAVIIATTTDVNVRMSVEALKAKKHVLVEKPLGSNTKQSIEVLKAVEKSGRWLKVGYNHRHHAGIMKAHEMVEAGAIGKILYIRAVYGHGARPGYDLEWRMQKKYSRGGELFDQGVHIIDLSNWFLGGFNKVSGQLRNYYWKKSQLEDNAFCQLLAPGGQLAEFHVSLTQWKNKFAFEIFGDKGYLLINGLGKSYGEQALVYGSKVGQGSAPEEEVFQFSGPDRSWINEWREFRSAILSDRQPMAGPKDNLIINRILEALYVSSKQGKIISL